MVLVEEESIEERAEARAWLKALWGAEVANLSPAQQRSAAMNHPELQFENWAERLWVESDGLPAAFMAKLNVEHAPVPDSLFSRLESSARRADRLEKDEILEQQNSRQRGQFYFHKQFVKSILEYYPSLLTEIEDAFSLDPASSFSDAKTYASENLSRLVGMNFDPMETPDIEHISPYFLWPSLMRLKSCGNADTPGKREVSRMISAVHQLIDEQNCLFASAPDRELPLYRWLNANFCNNGKLSPVIPQVQFGQCVASGVIFDADGELSVIKDEESIDRIDSPSTDAGPSLSFLSPYSAKELADAYSVGRLHIEPKGGKDSKVCQIADGDIMIEAKQFLRGFAWSSSNPFLHCIIEVKNEGNLMVLAQAAANILHMQLQVWSNIPIFIICVDQTSIRFAVAFQTRDKKVGVTELQAFSLHTRFVTEDDLAPMAIYLLRFRQCMVESRSLACRLSQNLKEDLPRCLHVYDKATYEDVPVGQLNCPPRRFFSDEGGRQYKILKFGMCIKSSQFKCLFRATAQRIDDGSVFSVVVRVDSRYGGHAHKVIAKRGFAPEFYCCDQYHPDAPDLKFIAMGDLEKISCLQNIVEKNLFRDLWPAITAKLEELKVVLREEGVVHGDLRPCNIIFVCPKEEKVEIRVVDFEFGTVSPGTPSQYPKVLNVNVFREWGCESSEEVELLQEAVITHERDAKMLDYCINQLGGGSKLTANKRLRHQ